MGIKRVINDFRYTFEKDFNEQKYWKRRKYVQEHSQGGYWHLSI